MYIFISCKASGDKQEYKETRVRCHLNVDGSQYGGHVENKCCGAVQSAPALYLEDSGSNLGLQFGYSMQCISLVPSLHKTPVYYLALIHGHFLSYHLNSIGSSS
jgi:hypothetical protein